MNSSDFDLYVKPFHIRHIKELEYHIAYCERYIDSLKSEINNSKFKIEEHKRGLEDEFYDSYYLSHWADIIDIEKERIQREYEESEKISGGICGHDIDKYT